MNTPSYTTTNDQAPHMPEHNKQYHEMGEQLYVKLYDYVAPPAHKIEFKGDFGLQHQLKDYYKDDVKNAFQDYIWMHFGFKVGYENESRGFGLRIQDYDITSNSYAYMMLKRHLNNAVNFIIERLEQKGEVVFSSLESRPPFFNKIVDQLLWSIGYTAKFVTQGQDKIMLIEQYTNPQNVFGDITKEIEKLPQLKQILDTQRSHKIAAEAVETEFSRDAISKLQNTDFGVVLVTNEMMSDNGFPSLVATIKQLASDPDKNIQVFAVDEVPAELGLRAIRPRNIIIGSPYKTRNEAGTENTKSILTGQEGTAHKKKLYGAGKTTTFIRYGDSEQEQTIVNFLKLFVFQKGLFPGHQVVE